uniref:Anaphase-promoting complex subunit 4 WD40 domain-containing protein n=1 Tax=Ciona savignyi TaxID=51511 RepID=H2YLV9_CIOSA
MEWDKDGDVLCILSEKSSTIFMWDANQKKVIKIDSGAKDTHTFLSWSRIDLHVAIGTTKGNVILYDHKVGRKVPILGKHSRKIVCGNWSMQNLLALGGNDNMITISDANGKTVHNFSVRDQPSLIRFSEMKRSGKSDPDENTVSLVVGKKTLYFYKMYDPENIIELAFQPKYGKIEAYHWFGDGYILIGFSNGFFVVISTHAKEIGQELFQVRNHHDYLSSIAISPVIRIHDLRELTEINAIINLEDEPKGVWKFAWTTDGQLLAVSTARGSLHCYLTKLPMLGDACGTKIAYLTSLLEVTVENKVEDEQPVAVSIDVEPTFVACGPYHLAAGMNNRAWFYYLSEKGNTLLLKFRYGYCVMRDVSFLYFLAEMEKTRDREYLGTIESMSLNSDYAAVLVKGKVQLHIVMEEREAKLFPEREDMGNITCSTLTNEFLIYGTDTGNLNFFFIEDWSSVNTYRHSTQIRSIYPDCSGSHVGVIDDKGDGFIYNPVNDSTLEIPSLPTHCHGILWENNTFDKGVFIVFDDSTIFTYIFHRESIDGPHVSAVGATHLPFTQRPLLLYNGTLTLQLASGKTTTLLLDTH